MNALSRFLFIVPLAVHLGWFAATAPRLPALLGTAPGAPGSSATVFLAGWLALLFLSTAAFLGLRQALPRLSDRWLAVPRRERWLASDEGRAEVRARLAGMVDVALLFTQIVFVGVYQIIYQTNVARPLVSVSEDVLLSFFVLAPLVLVTVFLLLLLRGFARDAS